MEMLIQDLRPILFNQSKEGTSYALFGHSLGGLIVYELYQAIEKQGITKLVHGPSVYLRERGPTEIYRLGGTSQEVLQSEELLQYITPILRK